MFYNKSFKIFLTIVIALSAISCDNNKLSYKDARRILEKTIYPEKVTADFILYVHYESKEEPEKWKDQQWKKNNDYLEKSGLLKQTILDTFIMFYIQSQARFEKKHQYIYKAILNKKIRSLMINPVFESNTFDEYDYYNRHTGRKDWYRGKVVCGVLLLDTILNINQKTGPLDVIVDYKEKYSPTPFNEIANYGKKFSSGKTFIKSIIARKYPEEDWKLAE